MSTLITGSSDPNSVLSRYTVGNFGLSFSDKNISQFDLSGFVLSFKFATSDPINVQTIVDGVNGNGARSVVWYAFFGLLAFLALLSLAWSGYLWQHTEPVPGDDEDTDYTSMMNTGLDSKVEGKFATLTENDDDEQKTEE